MFWRRILWKRVRCAFFALAVCAALLFGFAAGAQAADLWVLVPIDTTSNTGDSEADAYKIGSQGQLAWLASKVNGGEAYGGKYFELTGDIDLGGKEWTPIGKGMTSTFDGNFDGKNHKILNLKCNSDGELVGLFGIIPDTSSKIKNLHLVNVSIDSACSGADTSATGGIAGIMFGEIDNCSVTGSVAGGQSSSFYSDTGGIVGVAHGFVTNCFVGGSVTGGDSTGNNRPSSTGGIVGRLEGPNAGVVGCSVEADVTGGNIPASNAGGHSNAGGIAGLDYSGHTPNISNCYASGNVTAGQGQAGSNAGGIVGLVSLLDASKTAVSKCYSFGAVSSVSTGAKRAGGVIGQMDDDKGKVAASYWNKNAAGQTAAKGIANDTPSAQEPNTVALSAPDFANKDKFDRDADGNVWPGTGKWDIGNFMASTWIYPASDHSRPRLLAFFDGGGAVKPQFVWPTPNAVSVRAGEPDKTVAISALDFTPGQISVTGATPLNPVDATFTFSGNVLTVKPKATTALGATSVTVSFKVGGADHSTSFRLNVYEGAVVPPPLPTQVEVPVATPAGGSFAAAVDVTLSCATAGAEIRYTLDGSAPTAASTLYAGPIKIDATKTLKAIAVKAGMTDSDVLTQTYTITPGGGGGGGGGGCDAGFGLFALILGGLYLRRKRG